MAPDIQDIPPSPLQDISQHISPFFQPLLREMYPGYDTASLISTLGMQISSTENIAVQHFTNFCRSLSDIDGRYLDGSLVPPTDHLQYEVVHVIETIVFLIPSIIRATDNNDNNLSSYIATVENLLHILRNLTTLHDLRF